MSDLDDKIREALADSGQKEELFKEQSLMAEAVAPFKGKRRWVNVVGLFYGVLGFAIAVWGGYKCFYAEDTRVQVIWLGVFFVGILLNAFLKVFFWMEMHTNRVLREVKRVELLLVERKKDEDGS
ncbi:DUF6768 family protein [Pelagicoccus mobilis]|uniref:Uncharacterized protein n=1 Tax=Pelagicoccus mobilis TaxID=415221 RepID=A0A934VQX9_9BACT|nr:DUF6768 family protein [Pelagicoccus mobilis]MBK1878812.1 hypothetical protein [Pelagicoccus mobilis]